VRDAIIDIDITSPPEFESRYHVARGNYEHVDCSLAQMGPMRPTPSLAGWRTPVGGLWHTGAGAFPMAFLSGWPGRGSAMEVLRSGRPPRLASAVQRLRAVRVAEPPPPSAAQTAAGNGSIPTASKQPAVTA
jgi:beta-carotene ketolase (CrtO type)